MDKVPNPALWLLRLWDRMPSTSTARSMQVWPSVFGLRNGDTQILNAMLAMVAMADRTRDAVLASGLPDSMKSGMVEWRKAYDVVLPNVASNGTWDNTRSEFTIARRERLLYCAEWLDQVCAKPEETQTELDRIAAELQDLRAAIQEAEGIDDDFRALLLDAVECMRRAIAEYEVRGAAGIDAAFGEIFAQVLRRAKASDVKSPEAKGLVKRTLETAKSVASLNGLVQLGNTLLSAATNLLGQF